MGQYEDVLKFLAECEEPTESQMNTRTTLTTDAARKLEQAFPGLPRDYVDYLVEVGSGAFRECQYAVYDRFLDPSDIFDAETAASFGKRILCFGDNFSGDPAGFLPDDNWRVVELWHDSRDLHDPKQNFGEFIRGKILMDSDGNDLVKVDRNRSSK